MKARASLASAAFRRWSAMRRTFSRRACFCSWLGKCMRDGVRRRKSDIVPQMNKALPTAALLALAAALVPAAAQELSGTLKKIKDSGAITIGHRENSIPFSYLDPKQQPIGYSMDLCAAIVEEIKKELSLATLGVKFAAVTPQTRIQLMANGTIDIECG